MRANHRVQSSLLSYGCCLPYLQQFFCYQMGRNVSAPLRVQRWARQRKYSKKRCLQGPESWLMVSKPKNEQQTILWEKAETSWSWLFLWSAGRWVEQAVWAISKIHSRKWLSGNIHSYWLWKWTSGLLDQNTNKMVQNRENESNQNRQALVSK